MTKPTSCCPHCDHDHLPKRAKQTRHGGNKRPPIFRVRSDFNVPSKQKLEQFDHERSLLEEYLLTQGEDLRLGCPDLSDDEI
jgi:hypothetical protein